MRGSGLGRELVEAALERAREHGCARMVLDANEANAPALALYRSVGFDSWSASRPAATTCLCGCVSDFVDLVADRDAAGLDDVGAQARAVHHPLEDALGR